MGYAKGVRAGHASGRLREPVFELLDSILSGDERWWEPTFRSADAAYRHLGLLWHSRDVLPSAYRAIAVALGADPEPFTFAALVRWMRPYIVDEGLLSPQEVPSPG